MRENPVDMADDDSIEDRLPNHSVYDVDTLEEVTCRLGRIDADDFERLCYSLLRREFVEWARMEPRFNALGKSTPGTPDAHVRLEDDTYIAFQFTTTQESASDRMAVRRKVIEDIDKIKSPKCSISEKTTKVVVCVNTNIGGEEAVYHAKAAEYGWNLDLFSLHRLASILIRYPDLCDHFLRTRLISRDSYGSGSASDVSFTTEERSFDAGPRVCQIREDIGLNHGQFAELIGVNSERTLRSMEAGDTDCTESLLLRVATLSGASLNWLKFGTAHGPNEVSGNEYGDEHDEETRRYPRNYLTLYKLDADLKLLREAQPDRLFFCVELTNYAIMILTQTDEHHWRVFDLGITLDFWNWADEFQYIGRFRTLLKAVFDEYVEVSSRVVPKEDFTAVLEGRVYPHSAIRAAKGKGRHWAIDLDDVNHERYTSADYEKENGAWFLQVQQAMKDFQEGNVPKKATSVPLALLTVEREEKYPTHINLLPVATRGPLSVLQRMRSAMSKLRPKR